MTEIIGGVVVTLSIISLTIITVMMGITFGVIIKNELRRK